MRSKSNTFIYTTVVTSCRLTNMAPKEFTSRGGKRMYAHRAEFDVYNNLPYGIWVCDDGREVLFNRFYEPLRQRYPGQPATDADPTEWVKWKTQDWFYDDGTKNKKREALKALW
jgi:hypothetical protein